MKRKLILPILLLIFVFPSFSKGNKEEQQETIIPKKLDFGNSGNIEGVSINDRNVIVSGSTQDFSFHAEIDKVLDRLLDAKTYHHKSIARPDGAINILELNKGDDLICWVGDGIRADMGPSGLKVFPDEGVDKIKVETDGKSWDVTLKKETHIVWNDREYIVFVSKIKKGTMLDQPEFSVDLVIMLK